MLGEEAEELGVIFEGRGMREADEGGNAQALIADQNVALDARTGEELG